MKNLNKEININKKFIVMFVLLNFIIMGMYYSYALFQVSVIQDNVVVIKTGSVNITTSITDLDSSSFTLTSGETKTVTVNLNSTNEGNIEYKMYYDVTSGISDFIVTSTEVFTDDIVEGSMETTKTITFTFQNTGNNDITIQLGTQGGLSGYDIELKQGIELVLNTELGTPIKSAITTGVNNPTDTSCKTYVEEDGIIYISGTADCIDFNYVWYSGKLWRITAIYPNGTMKMITDDVMTTISWGAKATVSSSDLTSAYTTSWIREWLNQEFLPTLYNYENIIVEDAGWYSITDSSSTPTKPTGDYSLTDPVGLLNAYEYYMSYKNTSNSKANGYLNIGYQWFLITPYNSKYIRYVSSNSELSNYYSHDYYGVRPSISLNHYVQLDGGSGTKSDPYRIKGEKEEAIANTTLLNTRVSGEYVKLENDSASNLFRIVDTEKIVDSETNIEKLTTKMVLNDYVKDVNDVDADGNTTEVLTKYFATAYNHELWSEVDKTDKSDWRGYLNNTWILEIDNTYNLEMDISRILKKGIYYLGYYPNQVSYKQTVCSTVNSNITIKQCIENNTLVSDVVFEDYIGLLRIGEMFATQAGDYISSTASTHWLITPHGGMWLVSRIT